MSLPQRCTIEKAELILDLKRRNIQAMAARGEIPGAAKLGHLWSVNVAQPQRGSNATESADRMLLAWQYPLGSHLYQRSRNQTIVTDERPKSYGTATKGSARAQRGQIDLVIARCAGIVADMVMLN
jgi:hypothetical protein